jgi:hypothetical protein
MASWSRFAGGAVRGAPDRSAGALACLRLDECSSEPLRAVHAWLSSSRMAPSGLIARVGVVAAVVAAPLPALVAMAPVATGFSVQYCAQVPIIHGTPPWGFHTGAVITGATGSYARGHGDINLARNTVSGILCQVNRVRHRPDRLIIMTVEHHLVYHSHHAIMWGVPGNLMKIRVRVSSSTDQRCKLGTIGRVTLFASYNGVRSDSVKFSFPGACKDHDHLYHGPQVDNQVPPR